MGIPTVWFRIPSRESGTCPACFFFYYGVYSEAEQNASDCCHLSDPRADARGSFVIVIRKGKGKGLCFDQHELKCSKSLVAQLVLIGVIHGSLLERPLIHQPKARGMQKPEVSNWRPVSRFGLQSPLQQFITEMYSNLSMLALKISVLGLYCGP